MDKISGTNFDAIKEPRGFIKFLQIIIAILAFATTTSLNTESKYSIQCHETVTSGPAPTPTIYTIKISYPFNIADDNKNLKKFPCNSSNDSANIYGNFSSASQFYVFIGVMAFLYSIGAIILYTVFSEKYTDYPKLPMIDLVITISFVALWLISASAWADSFTKLRHYTDPTTIFFNGHINGCNGKNNQDVTCDSLETGDFGKLYASIIFGFLNLFIWAANCWFLYKETSFFRAQQHDSTEDFTKQQSPDSYQPTDYRHDYPTNP